MHPFRDHMRQLGRNVAVAMGRLAISPRCEYSSRSSRSCPERRRSRSSSGELEHRAHVDAALQAAGNRAKARVEAVHALDFSPLRFGHRESVGHRDPLDHEHRVAFEHLANGLNVKALGINFDLTRFQRAGEGAGQSPARGGDHVIQGRRVRREILQADPVVGGDLGMHTKSDRLLLGR